MLTCICSPVVVQFTTQILNHGTLIATLISFICYEVQNHHYIIIISCSITIILVISVTNKQKQQESLKRRSQAQLKSLYPLVLTDRTMFSSHTEVTQNVVFKSMHHLYFFRYTQDLR